MYIKHECAICKRRDVKLYRVYGVQDFHPAYCKRHIPKTNNVDYVPCVEDIDGSVWGLTSIPKDAAERFNALA